MLLCFAPSLPPHPTNSLVWRASIDGCLASADAGKIKEAVCACRSRCRKDTGDILEKVHGQFGGKRIGLVDLKSAFGDRLYIHIDDIENVRID